MILLIGIILNQILEVINRLLKGFMWFFLNGSFVSVRMIRIVGIILNLTFVFRRGLSKGFLQSFSNDSYSLISHCLGFLNCLVGTININIMGVQSIIKILLIFFYCHRVSVLVTFFRKYVQNISLNKRKVFLTPLKIITKVASQGE